ncbi:hypothetical protein KA005_27100 [bacterium]|nr:hypothetical protein [bacterium]
MECLTEYLPELFQVLAVIAAGFAAVFLYTDKNRHELFARKLSVYQELNRLAGIVFSLSLKTQANKEMFIKDYQLAKIEIFEYLLTSSLLITNEVSPLINDFLMWPQDDPEGQRVAYNKAISFMAKDIRIDKLEAITNLSTGEYASLLSQYKNKEKNQ